MIRLRVCAGCSEPLLVAYTTLLEISCRGSFNLSKIIVSREFANATTIQSSRIKVTRCSHFYQGPNYSQTEKKTCEKEKVQDQSPAPVIAVLLLV